MRNQTLFATLGLALLGACVGGLDMPGGGGGGGGGGTDASSNVSTGRALFNSTVFPIMDANCSGCHVGPATNTTNPFLGQTAHSTDSYYNGITNDNAVNGDFVPSAASLLLEGPHTGISGGGPALSNTDAMTVAAWLTQEASDRGTAGNGSAAPPPPAQADLTARGAEMQWAACLSVSTTEYNTTKAYAIADMQSDNGRCYSCHEPGGAGGAYWGKDNTYLTMLQKWQEEVFITGAFEAEAQNTSPVTYKMAVAQQKICDKGQEQANNQGTHPPFVCTQTVDGVQPLTALASFTTMVQAKLDADMCPAPAFYVEGQGSGSGSGSGGV